MTQDDKIHAQPVQTTAKPATDDKLQAAPPLEDDQGDSGDHTAAGLLRQTWALRDGRGEHEINVHGETVSRGEQSLGETVFQDEGETSPSSETALPPEPTQSAQQHPTTQPQSRVDESQIPPSSQQQAEKMQRVPNLTQDAADAESARRGLPAEDADDNTRP